jgi:hypothetical protein
MSTIGEAEARMPQASAALAWLTTAPGAHANTAAHLRPSERISGWPTA